MAKSRVKEVVDEEWSVVGVPYGVQYYGVRQIRRRFTPSLTPQPVARPQGKRSSLSQRCRSRPSVEHRSHQEIRPILLSMSGNATKVETPYSQFARRAPGKPHWQLCGCVLHDQTRRRLPVASPGPKHEGPRSSDRAPWLVTKARKMRHLERLIQQSETL